MIVSKEPHAGKNKHPFNKLQQLPVIPVIRLDQYELRTALPLQSMQKHTLTLSLQDSFAAVLLKSMSYLERSAS